MALLPFFYPSTLRDEAQTVTFSLVRPSLAQEPTAGRRVGHVLTLAPTLSSAWSLLHLDSWDMGSQPQTTYPRPDRPIQCIQTKVTIIKWFQLSVLCIPMGLSCQGKRRADSKLNSEPFDAL